MRPTEDKVFRFEPTGETFGAMYKAKAWLSEHGYRYGSSDWGPFIPAIKSNKYDLPQKLYNFNREDYKRVNAVIYSHDYREGWCEVWLVEYMHILILPLKEKWYRMIESGEKREEYREIKPYWIKRLFRDLGNAQYKQPVDWTHVQFTLGYPPSWDKKRRMTFKIDGIDFGMGKPEWGAPTDKEVFIIKIGERYGQSKCKSNP